MAVSACWMMSPCAARSEDGGATHWSIHFLVASNGNTVSIFEDNARAFPGGNARHPRPSVVRSGQGLPAHGRGRRKKRIQQQQPLRLGTLNIGTITGRSRELADTLKTRRIDIACIQETKWTGAKARDIGDGFKLFYNSNKPQNGVGLVVSKKARDNVVEVTRISDRLMSLKIDTGDITMRVISCYAPQTNCLKADKEDFWETRINATWTKWRQVTAVLCDRRIPYHLKAKIYKTVVRPVALYGSECWPTTAKHEQALHTMEMRMLRWCLGLTCWDQVMNEDVRKRLGIAPIMEKMREARLRWYGHVVCADDNSVAKTAMRLDPGDQRPRGRPKKRWMDRIKEDMKIVNLAPEDALDRAKLRRICRKADSAKRDKC
ncbi:uncharacterized protein LOC120540503 [Polypterus senegalus]|uniref:uncharacterized protein LOC120540503 n=1 Tax=Polypterus senegalus TaxID=55291 RepID=UPI0019634C45|nr:uncharacterized protein LOC120540503 [Polypterus senegalus]